MRNRGTISHRERDRERDVYLCEEDRRGSRLTIGPLQAISTLKSTIAAADLTAAAYNNVQRRTSARRPYEMFNIVKRISCVCVFATFFFRSLQKQKRDYWLNSNRLEQRNENFFIIISTSCNTDTYTYVWWESCRDQRAVSSIHSKKKKDFQSLLTASHKQTEVTAAVSRAGAKIL